VNEDIQVNIKQVWKRKDNGLLGRVSGLIFLEPKRVMWRALPNHGKPDACLKLNSKNNMNTPTRHNPRSIDRRRALFTYK
jgi:hypothetical protein